MAEQVIRKEDILYSLKLMDICEGDTLLVHSSLSSIGRVEGGTDTVIDALLEALGEEGTLVMSTLTGWAAPFDVEKTPSAVGKISETFRLRKGAFRSRHPVHSVAAMGKHAEEITSGHEFCPTGCGAGTPYWKIKELGGKVMLLGVDMDRNTVMHSLEEATDAVYLKTQTIPAPTYQEGSGKKEFMLRKFPPGHRNFIGFTPLLRENDALVEGRIGNAVCKVMEMEKLFKIGLKALKENPMLFICDNENCNFCHWARLLYQNKKIDYERYRGNGCVDGGCEICVVD